MRDLCYSRRQTWKCSKLRRTGEINLPRIWGRVKFPENIDHFLASRGRVCTEKRDMKISARQLVLSIGGLAFAHLVQATALAPLAHAVVLSTNEQLYRTDLTEAKARARDFEALQKQAQSTEAVEQKAIDQFKSQGEKERREEEKLREAYVQERNRRPVVTVKEDELEQKWQDEQDRDERLHDRERAQYISMRHHLDQAIASEAPINSMAEYGLESPASPHLTEYLKQHPVKPPTLNEKFAPDGEIIAPGAKKISSPPPGGDSSF